MAFAALGLLSFDFAGFASYAQRERLGPARDIAEFPFLEK
jgi:hypothetical protein